MKRRFIVFLVLGWSVIHLFRDLIGWYGEFILSTGHFLNLFDEQVECPNNRTPLGFWHLLSLMTLKLSEALKWTSGWTKRYLGNKWQAVYYLSTKYKYVLKSLIGFRQIKPISVGWVSNWYLPAIFPLFVAWFSLWIKATQPE